MIVMVRLIQIALHSYSKRTLIVSQLAFCHINLSQYKLHYIHILNAHHYQHPYIKRISLLPDKVEVNKTYVYNT